MVGVSYTVNKNVRTPEVVADNLIYPERAKAKKKGVDKKAGSPCKIVRVYKFNELCPAPLNCESVKSSSYRDS